MFVPGSILSELQVKIEKVYIYSINWIEQQRDRKKIKFIMLQGNQNY